MVLDHGDGRALGQLPAQVFGVKRLVPLLSEREDFQPQAVFSRLVLLRSQAVTFAEHSRSPPRHLIGEVVELSGSAVSSDSLTGRFKRPPLHHLAKVMAD